MDILAAVGYAIVLWWVSTGAIIVMYRRPAWTYDATFGAYTVVAAVSAVLLFVLRQRTDMLAVYASFSAGTLLWGWNLASYYTGLISGPKRAAPRAVLTDAERFTGAIAASAYHESVSIGLVILSVWGSWGAANLAGFGCVILFYSLHMLAKLAIYFGVMNFSGAWLPDHLRYITTFFGPPRFHWFSVCAVGLSVIATVWCIIGLQNSLTAAAITTHAFWALLCGAAVLELCVLLIPEQRLHRILAFLTHLSGAAKSKML